jgi:hypothetical protein
MFKVRLILFVGLGFIATVWCQDFKQAKRRMSGESVSSSNVDDVEHVIYW